MTFKSFPQNGSLAVTSTTTILKFYTFKRKKQYFETNIKLIFTLVYITMMSVLHLLLYIL